MGRVAVAAARLEFVAGMVAHTAAGLDPAEDWDRLAGRPNAVLPTLRRACKSLAVDHPRHVRYLERFADQVQECTGRRNAIVHAFLVTGWEDGETTQLLHHARDGERRPLPTSDEIDPLIKFMDSLASRAVALSDLATRLRSGEPPDAVYLPPLLPSPGS